jgi:hypothetical protein
LALFFGEPSCRPWKVGKDEESAESYNHCYSPLYEEHPSPRSQSMSAVHVTCDTSRHQASKGTFTKSAFSPYKTLEFHYQK